MKAEARQTASERRRDNAELEIARELCGYSVDCYQDGPRRKIAAIYDGSGTCVAMFTALSWKACIAAARGWNGVAR